MMNDQQDSPSSGQIDTCQVCGRTILAGVPKCPACGCPVRLRHEHDDRSPLEAGDAGTASAHAHEQQESPPLAPAPSPTGATDRRMFDIINVPLLALVAVCFFLPLCELDCGQYKARFNGVNLTLGTAPAVEGLPSSTELEVAKAALQGLAPLSPGGAVPAAVPDRGAQLQDADTDPLFGVVPIAALAGAILFVIVLIRRSRGNSVYLLLAPAVLTVVIAGYAVFGYSIERHAAEVVSKAAQQGAGGDPGVRLTCEKSSWFYFSLAASALSLALTASRRWSPLLVSASTHGQTGTDRVEVQASTH